MTKDKPHTMIEGHLDLGDGGSPGLFVRLRRDFLAGVLVTAPIGITIYLTYVFLTFIDNRVSKIVPEAYYPQTEFPGVGLLITIIFFIVVGWFARNVLGRLVIRVSEYIVDRMPVVRTIYSATKQIFETIMASQSQAFRDVVMLEYPRKGVWSIGFVTGTSEGEVQRVTSKETVNVFVPTTPNPTSGYLLFVPRKELKYLDMTVEEGVKLVVSAGIIVPPDRRILPAGEAITPEEGETRLFDEEKSPEAANGKKKKAAK